VFELNLIVGTTYRRRNYYTQ